MPTLNNRADALQLAFYETPPLVGLPIPMFAALRTIPGVIVSGAGHRNGPGKGALRAELDGRSLSWKAPGSAAFGPAVIASADGNYLLEDGADRGKFLQISVQIASLRPAPIEQAIYLQDRWNAALSNLTAAEAGAGTTAVSLLELRNISAGTLTNLRGWLEPGNATLSISADGAAYSAPTTEPAGLDLGTLAAGASRRFWMKRIVAPGATANPKVFAGLHFRFDGV